MESRSTPTSRLAGVLIASGALSLVALGAYFLAPPIQVQSTGSEGVSAVLIEVEEAVSEEAAAEETSVADKSSEFDRYFVIEIDDSYAYRTLAESDLIKVTVEGSDLFRPEPGATCDIILHLQSDTGGNNGYTGTLRIDESEHRTASTFCGFLVVDEDYPMPN